VIALSLAGGSLVLLATGATAIVRTDWTAVSRGALLAIVYGGIGGLVVGYLLWYRGVKVLGPTRTHLYANLQPFIALLVAWLTLGEMPSISQSIGAATIVGGVLLTRVQATAES
jgi:drug/metabolite transporter (DMT)-like permease